MRNTNEQNKIWQMLFSRQIQNIEKFACHEYIEGLSKIQFDENHIPSLEELNNKLNHTGWNIINTNIRYLNAKQWVQHIARKEFPITKYLRSIDELDFTPEPDMFHDIFGHLPFLLNNDTLQLINIFAKKMEMVHDENIDIIAKLWWFSIEFGLIKEGKDIKAFGTGLMSSLGEINHVLDEGVQKKPFTIKDVIVEDPAVYSFHNGYFVIYSVRELIGELTVFFKTIL